MNIVGKVFYISKKFYSTDVLGRLSSTYLALAYQL